MPTNITEAEYNKAKLILEDFEQPLPEILTDACTEVEWSYNKDVVTAQSNIDLVNSWNTTKLQFDP